MHTFLGYTRNIKAINMSNIGHARILKAKAIELIEILKKNNHLE